MTDEIAWVIERDIHSRLHYWAGRNSTDWRTDHMDALRFARQADAELMLTYHCDGIGRVVEHMWCALQEAGEVSRSQTAQALEPCPFCGAAMEQHPEYPDEWRHAYRRGVRCPAGATVVYTTDAASVAAWNRRVSPPVGD